MHNPEQFNQEININYNREFQAPDQQRFARILRLLREREGFNQRRLAIIVGIDESTIFKIENGTRRPPDKLLMALPQIPGFDNNDIKLLRRTIFPESLRPDLYQPYDESEEKLLHLLAKKPVTEVFDYGREKIIGALVGHVYLEANFHRFPAELNGVHQEQIVNVSRYAIVDGLRDIIRSRLQKLNQQQNSQ